MSNDNLTIADFFCGAGGFSEGFRQMGLELILALDFWQPAITTHELNHPECKTLKMDILELDTPEKIDHYVPDVDVIIGSPPCVSFSGSNKAGKADKSLGIQLIEAYLRIIAWKMSKGKLKYWILENVPNAGSFIKDQYIWEELGLPGNGPDLMIKQKCILNSADYGAPQVRRRFFCGNFPLPEPSIMDEKNYLTFGDVLKSLTNPLDGINQHEIKDPNYHFTLDSTLLTDHFYDTRVADFEWKKARRLKEDHGFMGVMSFPENLQKPSRTVMATRSASTRESMILEAIKDKKKIGYRLPTIREIASLMSFPITYQFEAVGESTKYTLVGNAVCPKLSAALAKAILKNEGKDIPEAHFPIRTTKYDLTGSKRVIKQPRNRNFESKFARHIPNMKIRSFRVDLTNIESNFNEKKIKWSCIIHQGSGKNATKCNSNECNLIALVGDIPGFDRFKNDVEKTFGKLQLTQMQLHKSYIYVQSKSLSPDKILEMIHDLIEKHYKDNDSLINNEKRYIKIERDLVPLKIAIGAFACDYFVQQLT